MIVCVLLLLLIFRDLFGLDPKVHQLFEVCQGIQHTLSEAVGCSDGQLSQACQVACLRGRIVVANVVEGQARELGELLKCCQVGITRKDAQHTECLEPWAAVAMCCRSAVVRGAVCAALRSRLRSCGSCPLNTTAQAASAGNTQPFRLRVDSCQLLASTEYYVCEPAGSSSRREPPKHSFLKRCIAGRLKRAATPALPPSTQLSPRSSATSWDIPVSTSGCRPALSCSPSERRAVSLLKHGVLTFVTGVDTMLRSSAVRCCSSAMLLTALV